MFLYWEDQEDNQVLRNDISDISNKYQNIFNSKKRFKAATVEGLEAKLNSTQRFF